MYNIKDLYDLDHTITKDYLLKFEYPWQALSGIKDLVKELGEKLNKEEYIEVKPTVWVHKSADVFDSAYLGEYIIVGENCQIRHCAYLRGPAIIGNNAVIGNSCELKNVIIFDNAEVPHYNYVGDSILGYKAHMGAGSITSNIKSDRKNIVIRYQDEVIETGLRKMGAMLGDYAEIGCNSVLNPGTVVGRCSNVYPTSCVRGVVDEYSIFKNNGEIVKKHD